MQGRESALLRSLVNAFTNINGGIAVDGMIGRIKEVKF